MLHSPICSLLRDALRILCFLKKCLPVFQLFLGPSMQSRFQSVSSVFSCGWSSYNNHQEPVPFCILVCFVWNYVTDPVLCFGLLCNGWSRGTLPVGVQRKYADNIRTAGEESSESDQIYFTKRSRYEAVATARIKYQLLHANLGLLPDAANFCYSFRSKKDLTISHLLPPFQNMRYVVFLFSRCFLICIFSFRPADWSDKKMHETQCNAYESKL